MKQARLAAQRKTPAHAHQHHRALQAPCASSPQATHTHTSSHVAHRLHQPTQPSKETTRGIHTTGSGLLHPPHELRGSTAGHAPVTADATAPPRCSAGAQQVIYTTTKGLNTSTNRNGTPPPACLAQQASCGNLHRLGGPFSGTTLSRLKTLPAGSAGQRSTMPQAAPPHRPTHAAGAGRRHAQPTHTPPWEHTRPTSPHHSVCQAASADDTSCQESCVIEPSTAADVRLPRPTAMHGCFVVIMRRGTPAQLSHKRIAGTHPASTPCSASKLAARCDSVFVLHTGLLGSSR